MSFIRFGVFLPARYAKAASAVFALVVFAFGSPVWSQQTDTKKLQKTSALTKAQLSPQRQTGSVTGKVVDQSGTQVVGASVILTQTIADGTKTDASTDEDGRFVFTNV